MKDFSTLATLVRTLDPAGPADGELGKESGERARTDLARILATNPNTLTAQPDRNRRAPRVRRPVLAATAVAATATAFVTLPAITRGDAAFATWIASPSALTVTQSAEVAQDCRDTQESGSTAYATQLKAAHPVVADRRGEWTTVVLATGDGFSALCVTDGSSGLPGGWFTDMFGSIGVTETAPHARELIATDLGTGTISAGDLSLIAGRAGADIVSVTYHSSQHGDVHATVTDGWFALWFPGDELIDAGRDGAEVRVTYQDGSQDLLSVML